MRSPLRLPHALHGWQEAEYAAWLEEHSIEDALSLVEGDLAQWETLHKEAQDAEADGYIALCRSVLSNASKSKGI